MAKMLLLILISCTLSCVKGLSPALDLSKRFFFVNESKTFAEAQLYCRDQYTDLVTLSDQSEMEEMLALEDLTYTTTIWIGLKKGSHDQWQWALAQRGFYKEGETNYINWRPTEPNNGPDEVCSVMDDLGLIRDTTCKTPRGFICYNGRDNNKPKYIFISTTKAWRDAQRYCREFYTDLVSVRNPMENQEIHQLVPPQTPLYIGLFKDTFAWSDGITSSFRNWDLLEPDGSGDCVVLQLKNHMWDDRPCENPRPFFCYTYPVFKQVVRLELELDQDVNDPNMQASILEKIRQKLVSLGLSETSDVEWRKQDDGNIFMKKPTNEL